jgi:quercetin dioxygenase-like cupin family protein
MPSIERPLAGDVMLFRLDEESSRAGDPTTLERHGRSARTLLKDGPLRVTLITIAAGGHIAEHQADGPITVQALRGTIHFTAAGEVYDVRPGELLTVGAGIRHSVAATDEAAFLLTVSLRHTHE